MILRTTFKDGETLFEDLGDKFVLNSKQRSPAKFDESFNRVSNGSPNNLKDCFAFISPLGVEYGEIPLFTDFYYSVLSDRGSEVMKISIRDL